MREEGTKNKGVYVNMGNNKGSLDLSYRPSSYQHHSISHRHIISRHKDHGSVSTEAVVGR